MIKVLGIKKTDVQMYICEDHFSSSDVKSHGNTKRLRKGAIPKHFPLQDVVLWDHYYLGTAPLNLVCTIFVYKEETLLPQMQK